VLAFYFIFNLLGDLGVGEGQRRAEVDGHSLILCHGFERLFISDGGLGFLQGFFEK
jgi:hypothetical protein